MAKQSGEQKRAISRVMHEYKRGELESGSGKKVKSRKQAIAIGLKEAGASRYESKAENKRNLSRTRKKERKGKTARQRKEGRRQPGGSSGVFRT